MILLSYYKIDMYNRQYHLKEKKKKTVRLGKQLNSIYANYLKQEGRFSMKAPDAAKVNHSQEYRKHNDFIYLLSSLHLLVRSDLLNAFS